MKKKSFVALMLAIVMAVVAMFTLAGCGDDPETTTDKAFDGIASTETYDTQTEAAEDYVSVEISGKATTATFESYEKSGESLTAEQIAALNLGDINAEDVTEAENGVITYYDADVKKTIKIVIFKTADGYHYYTPKYSNGATVTKGYFDVVFDHSKYMNMTETGKTTSKVSAGGQTATADVTVVSKVTENAISSKMTGTGVTTKEYYIVPRDNELIRYEKEGSSPSSSWTKLGAMAGMTSVDDFLDTAFAFDWTYFVKTSYGFKLDSDKATKYANDMLGTTLRPMQTMYSATISSISAEYYVVDGRLDHVEVKVTMKGKTQGVALTATVTGKTTYTYGTTVVDEPEGLPD